MKRLHLIVSGLVQGVFFRAHIKSWSSELKLIGWAKNLKSGELEIVAEGSEKNLNELLKRIKKGTPMSKVKNIKKNWNEPLKKFDTFEIRH